MKRSQFVFESVDLLYYSLHKISLNRGGSYIYSPEWLKNKTATINPKNKDNECFKHAITVALNHERIKNHPDRIFKKNIQSTQSTQKEYLILSLLLINITGRG